MILTRSTLLVVLMAAVALAVSAATAHASPVANAAGGDAPPLNPSVVNVPILRLDAALGNAADAIDAGNGAQAVGPLTASRRYLLRSYRGAKYLIASMYTGNIIGVVMVLAFVPLFAAILKIPFAILTPLIVVVCAVGSYAVHNSMIDVWYMVIFGVVGYVFKKLDYPLAPLVLALVLGDLAENALRQSLIMSQGSLAIFFTRPISGVIMFVAVLFFMLPVVTPWWRRLRGAPVATPAARET